MIVLVGFYQDAAPQRTREFVECVRRNCENRSIDRLIVFIECDTPAAELKAQWSEFAHSKIHLIEHRRRLAFDYLFEFANLHLTGAAIAIVNADIFFDETLRLLDTWPLSGKMLCLSRWDEASDGEPMHYDNPCSQDAWIFEAPVPNMACHFSLGVPGCDNRLAYEAERAGLAVANPSRSVRARHLHRSGVRRYSARDRLHGPNRLVPPSFLEECRLLARPSVLEFPSHRGHRVDSWIDEKLHEIVEMLMPHLGGIVPQALRRELRQALGKHGNAAIQPVVTPLASVAFRESMGYTLAKLELGVSTHNNDPRPLASAPPELTGLSITQVVANHAAPVEIEFRSPGRLFVLAALGWEGYAPASQFLDDAGWREPGLELTTRDGGRFHAWSLIAGAGERLVVPTQVMLASSDLARFQ